MRAKTLMVLVAALAAAACSATRDPPRKAAGAVASFPGVYKLGTPYKINGRWYYPTYDPHYDRVGVASWYGDAFHGKLTANGEIFDKNRISAAHPTLPLPSLVQVTNLENGRSMVVRVNDRGPFIGDRLIDLSEAAARELGFHGQGLARVRVRFVELAEARGTPPAPTPAARRAVIAAQEGPKPPAERPTRHAPPGMADGDAGLRLASASGLAASGRAVASPSLAVCRTGARYVQVGAFADPARARSVMRAVRALPAAVHVEPVFVGDRAAARVRLGPVASDEAAQTLLDELRRLGYRDAFVAPGSTKAVSERC